MAQTHYKPGQLYSTRKGSTLTTYKVGAGGKPQKISTTTVVKKSK